MVVRMRSNKGHTANRRSHFALRNQAFLACPHCGNPKLRHQVCVNCGKYKGKEVINVAAALEKKQKKIKARQSTQGQ